MKKKQKTIYCDECSVVLYKDEVALSKKMFGRSTITFYCLKCTAAILDCAVADLEVKINEFKEQGCVLFL